MDHLQGAIEGMLLAAVLGQVPPFTALPDEIVGLPAGAVVGGYFGAKKLNKWAGL